MSEAVSPELLRGSLDLLVLSVLASGPQYGYSIGQRLRDTSGGMVALQAGTLYPLLHRLETDRLIRSKWDDSTGRRRKWYELTAAGRKRLHRQARQWHEYVECLSRILAPALEAGPEPA